MGDYVGHYSPTIVWAAGYIKWGIKAFLYFHLPSLLHFHPRNLIFAVETIFVSLMVAFRRCLWNEFSFLSLWFRRSIVFHMLPPKHFVWSSLCFHVWFCCNTCRFNVPLPLWSYIAAIWFWPKWPSNDKCYTQIALVLTYATSKRLGRGINGARQRVRSFLRFV